MRNIRSPLDGPFGTGPFGSNNLTPRIVIPGTQALGASLLPLVFSTANGNVISVRDPKQTSLTISIAVDFGHVTLDGTTGLSFSVGDGTADATMTFSGTITNINNALDGMSFGGSGEADVMLVISASNTKYTTTRIVYVEVGPYAGDILGNFVATGVSGGTTAEITISCSESDGTLFVVVLPSGATAPSAEQIEAGTDGLDVPAVWAAENGAGVPIASIDTWSSGPSGLIQDTDYVAYAVRKAPDDSYSNIVTDDFSTTDEVPVISLVADVKTGSDTATITITNANDSGGTNYLVIVPFADSNPSAAQVKAGKNAANTDLASNLKASAAVSGIGVQAGINITGLTPATAYKAVAVQEDANATLGAVVAGDGFTTDSTETNDATLAANGSGTGWTNSLCTITGSQTDYDGGSNAIKISTTDGANTAYTSLSPAITHYAGMQHVRMLVKYTGTASSWVRARITNTGLTNANTEVFFRPSDMTVGNNGSLVSGTPTLTSVGSDWYLLDYNVDLTGGDTSGNVQFAFTSTNGGTGMDGTGNEAFTVYNIRLGH